MTTFYWIMEYVASFIEISMCCIFCGTFLEKERLGDRKYLVLAGSGIGAILVIVLNRIDIFSYINSMLVTLIVLFLQLLIYKAKVGKSVLFMLIYMVILTAIDFMTAYFMALVLDTDAGYLLNTQSLKRVICILLSKSLLILIIVTLSKMLKRTLIFLKRYVVIMCIYSIFLLVSLFVMVELNMNNGNPKTDLFLTIFFIASILIELLMFYFVIKTGESYEQRQKAELIEMKNRMLQKSLDETNQAFKLWKSSVHDYKHNIIALTQLADDGNIEEIKKYLKRENELMDRKMFYIQTGNSVVDAIVNTKQSFAEEKGITFVVNAKVPENCVVSELDMANILGNLIDNAIEASNSEEEPYIDVTMRQDKHFIVIKIINKYSREFSKRLETTKHKRMFHGIGIGSVKNIVEKYEGEFSIDKQGKEVIVKILIPNFK
ncbi:MAG: molecular chaperone Hsp90 [Clostridium sp. CAG:12237_41]|nr:MAG: molecular chaperone Hsp90 [Clostridium sp. CAG:12237_41]